MGEGRQLQTNQGQRERFVQGVMAQHGAMFRMARSMLMNDWDAEDAVSEAIGKAWSSLHSLRDWDRLRPWLLRITYRCALQLIRRRSREQPREPERMAVLAGAAAEELPMWVYLEMLPEKMRTVMQLRYQEGLPIDEIAAILRLPRGTVSARLSRATKALRAQIEQEEQADG